MFAEDFIIHDYISFETFRKTRLFLSLFFNLDCVLAMLLYTSQKSTAFSKVLGSKATPSRSPENRVFAQTELKHLERNELIKAKPCLTGTHAV